MSSKAYATYNRSNNTLEVVRSNETFTRSIPCLNLNPEWNKVHGVEISGDEILVFVGPETNPRPSHIMVYSLKSLSGGSRRSF